MDPYSQFAKEGAKELGIEFPKHVIGTGYTLRFFLQNWKWSPHLNLSSGQVKSLILDSSIELQVLPKPEAVQLLSSNFPKCQDFAKSIDCSSMGLHLVHFNQGTFRTVAVQPVALPSSLKGVPWQIRADGRPGEFQLLGPSVALDAVVPGRFGKLGAQLPMQLGIQECNDAGAEGKQANMARQKF